MTPLLALLLLLAQDVQRPAASDYVVGPQDRLSVTVFGESDLTKVVTVDSDGTFDFPLIGRVKAGGLGLRAIEDDVRARLKKGFLVNPQVSLEVETYRSQIVYVTGQVRTPGAVALTGVMGILDVLSRVGSTLPDAGSYILINRRPRAGAAPAEPERVSMKELQSGRAQHVVLSDGDTIFVPKAETFFVTGHVRNPGPYLLDSDVTVGRALSMAGGITDRGAKGRIKITRIVDGRQVVLRNVTMEEPVRPGDAIEVPPRFF
jgi:polysaccharide export outer membrane protein